MPRNILILITNTYPYDYGESFLEVEIDYLSKVFEQIIIFPFRKSAYIRKIPENARVIDILTKKSRFNILFCYLKRTLISKEFREELNNLKFEKKAFNFIKILVLYCKSLYIKNSVKSFVDENKLDYHNIIFYTYWLTSAAYGLCLLKQKYPVIKLVSRAHGYDLYAERSRTGYIPMQFKSLRNLDMLFLISDNGYHYLCAKYTLYQHTLKKKMKVSRLGVRRANSKNHLLKQEKKVNSPFRIITCSSFISIKRIDLLIDALSILDIKCKDKIIEWHHVGGGKGKKAFEKLANKRLRKQVSFQFYGTLTNMQVLALYKNTWFDLFINVSDSEGIPVSIMEALSFGIPVLARNVGGVSEIVNNNNGILLDRIVTPEQIAGAILTLIHSEKDLVLKRKEAFDLWEKMYNADVNYKQFVSCLHH